MAGPSPGARFRAAVAAERPLQVPGAVCAYHAILAERSGFKAIYLSGGGVAAGGLHRGPGAAGHRPCAWGGGPDPPAISPVGGPYTGRTGSGAGVGSGSSRNFFTWYVPSDAYNVERFDFNKGSNSLMFGDSNPGGQATIYTKRARSRNLRAVGCISGIGGCRAGQRGS